MRDPLTTGPCDPDRRRHARLRRQFWKRECELQRWEPELEPEPRWPRAGPIALWTSASVADRLFYWNAVDRLADLELFRIDAVHPDFAVESIRTLPPESIAYSVERGRRVGVREVAVAKRKWALFASGELGTLHRHLDAEAVTREWLRAALPQRSTHLRLSRLDETLLRPFLRWTLPHAAIRRWMKIFLVHGDVFVLNRLTRWEARGAFFSKPAPGKSPWTDHALKLTPLGVRLLRGLRSLDEAPRMFIGGHEVYGHRSWLLSPTGSLRRA